MPNSYIVNFSPWLQLAVEGQMDDTSGREELIYLNVHVRVAPPMIVGVWSMVVVLWQLLEYYYYMNSSLVSVRVHIHIIIKTKSTKFMLQTLKRRMMVSRCGREHSWKRGQQSKRKKSRKLRKRYKIWQHLEDGIKNIAMHFPANTLPLLQYRNSNLWFSSKNFNMVRSYHVLGCFPLVSKISPSPKSHIVLHNIMYMYLCRWKWRRRGGKMCRHGNELFLRKERHRGIWLVYPCTQNLGLSTGP